MRENDEYHVQCLCGQEIVTKQETFKCPKCGKIGEILWKDKKAR